MNVELKVDNIDYMINNSVQAMRTCYSSNDKSDGGLKDRDLLKGAVKVGHHTPLEFIQLTFSVEGLTRCVLQELVRHRTQALNVQSTRYTLKKMKEDISNLEKYFYMELPFYKEYLEIIFKFIEEHDLWKLPNDQLKLYMPESLKCDLYLTMNLRNFFNFYKLRSDNKAHFLIQKLAFAMYNELPEYLQELVDVYING
jgi:thymidylate synthase (FAD)